MSLYSFAKDVAFASIDPIGVVEPFKRASRWVSEKFNNARALKGVDPDVKDAAKELIASWNKANSDDTGATAYVFEGKRSIERQARLVEEGHSTTMSSKHIDGLAVDIWFWDNEANRAIAPDDVPWDWYQDLGERGEELGFSWGGRWTSFVDGPHFEAG